MAAMATTATTVPSATVLTTSTDEKLAMLIDWKKNLVTSITKFVEMMRTNPLPAVDAEARAGMWARQTKALEEETNAYMFARQAAHNADAGTGSIVDLDDNAASDTAQARKALQDSITGGSLFGLDS
jgi:hypothetical protein